MATSNSVAAPQAGKTAAWKGKTVVLLDYEKILICAAVLTLIAMFMIVVLVPIFMLTDSDEYKQHTCDYSNCRIFLGEMRSQDLKVTLDIQHLNDTASVTTYVPAAKAYYLCETKSGPCFSYRSHLELEAFSPYTWKLISFTAVSMFTLIPASVFVVVIIVIGGIAAACEYMSPTN